MRVFGCGSKTTRILFTVERSGKVGSVLGAAAAVAALTASIVASAGQVAVHGRNHKPTDPDLVALGKKLFNDTTLSNPPGMACVSCHDPATGFSYPDSFINLTLGPVPGIVPGRFGFRKPPSAAYAAYLPTGVPHYDASVQAYVGGLFYDGRAADTVAQAKGPFVNPNEMNDLVHGVGSPALVIAKIKVGPSGPLFVKTFGPSVYDQPTDTVYGLVAAAISAYEGSPEVSPFSSKYDAYLAGKVGLTAQELLGLRLVTGTFNGRPNGFRYPISAHCMDCHAISYDLKKAPDLWTNSCYANLGVPRNPANPYYTMTDPKNPGYNPQGAAFIDYGLGDFLYPLMGKPVADLDEGDPLQIDGTFKAPSLRNVDKRPTTSFIRNYMHNGVLKSLKDVVHFYNTRNLTTMPGEVIDFTKPDPYAGLKGTPLWAPPEWPSPTTLINPKGLLNDQNLGSATEQIGNLHLSPDQEDAIVAFLKTLSDGWQAPRSIP